MKKLLKFIPFILSMMILFSSMPVSADIIAEPDDKFFYKHMDEMQYVDAAFKTKGADGKVDVFQSPLDYTVVATIKNDTTIYISHTYTDPDGHEFGVVEAVINQEKINGWVPMDYMVEKYAAYLFISQYEDEILDESVEVSFSGMEGYYVYSAPGSEDYYFCLNYGDDDAAYASEIFIDEAGRKWGFIGYYYGHVDGYIYLEHPDMDPRKVMEEGFSHYDKRELREEDPEPLSYLQVKTRSVGSILLLAGISVATIVISAIIFLAIILGKKKKKN